MPSPLAPLQQARLVLASASPRRTMLLRQLGLSFTVDPSQVEERLTRPLAPAELAATLAREKAEDVAARHAEADLILGADTIVVSGGEPLGKPADAEDAAAMLGRLAGQWHQVVTGFALVAPRQGRTIARHAVSDVRFRPLEPDEIAAYVASGEPMDKAGAYAIQGLGALLVAEIRGDYNNIVGLPLVALDAAWRELGWKVL